MSNKEITSLRKLHQQYSYTLLQMHEAIGRKAGMSGTEHKYLGFLLQKGAMTAGEFASLTGLTTGAVTNVIDRFERKKLVKRQNDPLDRRKVIIVPDIEKIKALILPLYEDFRKETDRLFMSLDEQQRAWLQTYFTKSLAIMNRKIESLNEK
ncbi:hypothetical protein PIECOFPK_01970 [Mycovorax composti]|jgi:Transcriptional regulators|uniref:HTH marR-type domain-containing protein n=2 Tax=Chitinophagaceae TaxID=563835 RepID=A0ABZ2EL54_9BACT